MINSDKHRLVCALMDYEDEFATALAECVDCANDDDLKRLFDAFPDLIAVCLRMSDLLIAKHIQENPDLSG